MVYGIPDLLRQGVPEAVLSGFATFYQVGTGKLHLHAHCQAVRGRVAEPVSIGVRALSAERLCAQCARDLPPNVALGQLLAGCRALVAAYAALVAAPEEPGVETTATLESVRRILIRHRAQCPGPFAAEAGRVVDELAQAAHRSRAGTSTSESDWSDAALVAVVLETYGVPEPLQAQHELLAAQSPRWVDGHGSWLLAPLRAVMVAELLAGRGWEAAGTAALQYAFALHKEPGMGALDLPVLTAFARDYATFARSTAAAERAQAGPGEHWVFTSTWCDPGSGGDVFHRLFTRLAAPAPAAVDTVIDGWPVLIVRVPAAVAVALTQPRSGFRNWPVGGHVLAEDGDTEEVLLTTADLDRRESMGLERAIRAARGILAATPGHPGTP